MGVDEFGVDEMGVDEIESRQSGNKPSHGWGHQIELAMSHPNTGKLQNPVSLMRSCKPRIYSKCIFNNLVFPPVRY